MITTGVSSHVRYLLLSLIVERRPLLKRWPCDGLFFSTSVANETENLNIWFKLNQWAKIQ